MQIPQEKESIFWEKSILGDGFCGLNSVVSIFFSALQTPRCASESDILRTDLMESASFLQDIRHSIAYLKSHKVFQAQDAPDPQSIQSYASLKTYFQNEFFQRKEIQYDLVAKIFRIPMLRLIRAEKPDPLSSKRILAKAFFNKLSDIQTSVEQKAEEMIDIFQEEGAAYFQDLFQNALKAIASHPDNKSEALKAFQGAVANLWSPEIPEKTLKTDLQETISKMRGCPIAQNPEDITSFFGPYLLGRYVHTPKSSEPRASYEDTFITPEALKKYLFFDADMPLNSIQTGALAQISFTHQQTNNIADMDPDEQRDAKSFWDRCLQDFDKTIDPMSTSEAPLNSEPESFLKGFFSKAINSRSSLLAFYNGCSSREWAAVSDLKPLLMLLFPANNSEDELTITEHQAGASELRNIPTACASVQNKGGGHFDLCFRRGEVVLSNNFAAKKGTIEAFQKALQQYAAPQKNALFSHSSSRQTGRLESEPVVFSQRHLSKAHTGSKKAHSPSPESRNPHSPSSDSDPLAMGISIIIVTIFLAIISYFAYLFFMAIIAPLIAMATTQSAAWGTSLYGAGVRNVSKVSAFARSSYASLRACMVSTNTATAVVGESALLPVSSGTAMIAIVATVAESTKKNKL